MEYSIYKKDLDTFVLKYKNKELEFKSTVNMASRVQKYQEMAEAKMILDLAKQGMTVNDLKIEKKSNGKKYIDESNYNKIREIYRNKAMTDVFDEVCEELFDLKLADLIVDIGIEDEDKAILFATELMNFISGKSDDVAPSQETQTTN